MICKNCHLEVEQNYCANCGTPAELPRINGSYILQEIGNVLNFKKGIFYTIRALLVRPGESVKEFIHRDRGRLVKPIIFVIITSLIYMIAEQVLHFEGSYASNGDFVSAGGSANVGDFGDSAVGTIFSWIQSNYGYANILMAIFIAGWIKVFFRKYNYNFFEVIILLCFIMGIGMLTFTLFGIVEGLTGMPAFFMGGIVGIIYTSWAIGRFYDKSKKMSYLKGFTAYFLGMTSFYIGAALLGAGIDLIV